MLFFIALTVVVGFLFGAAASLLCLAGCGRTYSTDELVRIAGGWVLLGGLVSLLPLVFVATVVFGPHP